MIRRSTIIVIALTMAAVAMVSSPAHASSDYRVTARMFGSSTLRGKAIYKDKATSHGVRQDFKVEVENGIPMTSYEVRVNGVLIDTVTLSVLGRAELEMRTASF